MFRCAAFVAASLAAPAPCQTSSEPTEVAGPETLDVGASPGKAFNLSGGVTLASQYRYRGVSLSDDHPAIQGTVNLTHASGFYAGLWASSLDGFGERGGSNVELDLYAGYSTTVASGVTLDGGLLYYSYPGSTRGAFEYFEPYASVAGTLGPVEAKLGLAYAFDQKALAGNSNVYAFGDLASGLPGTPYRLKAHLGHSRGDTRLSPGGDYWDWSVGGEYTRQGLTLGVAYVDTDLTGGQAARVGASRDIVDAALVFTAGVTF